MIDCRRSREELFQLIVLDPVLVRMVFVHHIKGEKKRWAKKTLRGIFDRIVAGEETKALAVEFNTTPANLARRLAEAKMPLRDVWLNRVTEGHHLFKALQWRKEGQSFRQILDTLGQPSEGVAQSALGEALRRYCVRVGVEYPGGVRGKRGPAKGSHHKV